MSRRQDAVPAILVRTRVNQQVMDPETYKSVTIKRPEFLSAKPGNEVNIVKLLRIFIVP